MGDEICVVARVVEDRKIIDGAADGDVGGRITAEHDAAVERGESGGGVGVRNVSAALIAEAESPIGAVRDGGDDDGGGSVLGELVAVVGDVDCIAVGGIGVGAGDGFVVDGGVGEHGSVDDDLLVGDGDGRVGADVGDARHNPIDVEVESVGRGVPNPRAVIGVKSLVVGVEGDGLVVGDVSDEGAVDDLESGGNVLDGDIDRTVILEARGVIDERQRVGGGVVGRINAVEIVGGPLVVIEIGESQAVGVERDAGDVGDDGIIRAGR